MENPLSTGTHYRDRLNQTIIFYRCFHYFDGYSCGCLWIAGECSFFPSSWRLAAPSVTHRKSGIVTAPEGCWPPHPFRDSPIPRALTVLRKGSRRPPACRPLLPERPPSSASLPRFLPVSTSTPQPASFQVLQPRRLLPPPTR